MPSFGTPHMQIPLKDLMFEMRSLEPFPGVAARVLDLSAKKDIVPSELIDLVQTDPGITSKVLKLCNSAYYGFQREIASMHEAGNLLGVTTLVNLVLTSSAGKYFKDTSASKADGGRWEMCVANAIGSKIIASRHGKVDPERAYTAGLLENIGHLVLDRFVDSGMTAIRAVAHSGCSLLDAEKKVLGMHHAEIGARLITRWSLPEVLVDVIRHHHHPELAGEDKELAATIHLAEILTQEAQQAAEDADPRALLYEVSEAACDLTGLGLSDLEELTGVLSSEMARDRDFMNG